ncbi:MAG TPA: EAL domain-containing protein [Candidatus Limnocylindria bacterium]|nr:EAL domain-containing protein [Candidatus Limnocylindria bacterium]
MRDRAGPSVWTRGRGRRAAQAHRTRPCGDDLSAPTVAELDRLVRGDELQLLHQALVDMRTGRAVGVESVIRWRHPERGLLHAMEFVTAVPASGLAREFTQWILRTAATQLARWRAAGLHLGWTSVNTWPESLRAHLVDDTLRAAADAGLEPAAIQIETPPEATYDPATLDVVRALRAAGIRVAFDDFGDGDVRLTWLRDAAFDVIKVPVTFVKGPGGAFDDYAIGAAVGFARTMGATVVAEGVETTAIRDHVLGLGCDIGQGYLWSKIVPGDEIPRLVAHIRIDGAVDATQGA